LIKKNLEKKKSAQIGFFIIHSFLITFKFKKESNIKKNVYIQIMKNVTVYMGPMCAFCDAAKRLLTRNNIPYKEINIALEEGKMDEMLNKSNGKRTIPQIFFDEYHVGGFEELRALEKENKLLNLLK
jgi:glutaredoxin 3